MGLTFCICDKLIDAEAAGQVSDSLLNPWCYDVRPILPNLPNHRAVWLPRSSAPQASGVFSHQEKSFE